MTDAVFAQCPVGPGAVEPVIDSSRYFVVRIVDEQQGRKAFLGMGFQERSEAFDFTVSMQDFERRKMERKERESRPEEKIDMSAYELKPGQTITLNIKSTAPTAKKTQNKGFLPPPPAGKRTQFQAPPSINQRPVQQMNQQPQMNQMNFGQPQNQNQGQQRKGGDDIDKLLFF